MMSQINQDEIWPDPVVTSVEPQSKFYLSKVTINNILLKILVIDIAKLSFHQKQPNLNKPLLIN